MCVWPGSAGARIEAEVCDCAREWCVYLHKYDWEIINRGHVGIIRIGTYLPFGR